MDHSINLTHDGTLILRIPKGYQVDKVVVEEMGTENRKEYQPTRPTPSNTFGALDCVSREDLTKGIETYFGDLPITVHYDMLALAQKLPSVQPRKGKITYTYFCEELWGQSSICSLCGCSWQISEDGEDNFCPNCGADMRGGQE